MKFDGGKAVIQRILQAYGFSTQKQLHDHLGVGNGTVSTWIKRNYFPGEVVIRCALETGKDLSWLATGKNTLSDLTQSLSSDELVTIKCMSLRLGRLSIRKDMLADKSLFFLMPNNPLIVQSEDTSWLIESDAEGISEGKWLIEKREVSSISDIKLLPKNKLMVDNFEWPQDEVKFLGKVFSEINLIK
ncbi:Bacteriophage CI repressor helix-turn-helix domain [Serratia liquefaciens]|nr:phage repressor protein CI [Serratia fonticola]MDK2376215.1 phage repressor protein CI [Serratia fonticola]CAI0795754.1 Bacteriophage CI repressor helix-turn-helix domain [Serratia liquefaciens]